MEPIEVKPPSRRDRTPSAPILLRRLAQADSELEVPIDVEVVTPPPADAPEGFRERLALALGTTDARLLACDARESVHIGARIGAIARRVGERREHVSDGGRDALVEGALAQAPPSDATP